MLSGAAFNKVALNRCDLASGGISGLRSVFFAILRNTQSIFILAQTIARALPSRSTNPNFFNVFKSV